MRIIIEMNEAESRSASVSREVSGQQTASGQATTQAAALDGGPPPEALLLALGARTETSTVSTSPTQFGSDQDAGPPPTWLMNITTPPGVAH